MKRKYKYPELIKIESELDQLIKETEAKLSILENEIKELKNKPTNTGGGITISGGTTSAINNDEFLLRKAIDSYNYYTFKYQNLISQLNSLYALAVHQHNKTDIIGLNEGLVGTKEVDESNIANNKYLIYDNTLGKLKYTNKPNEFPFVTIQPSELTISSDGTGVTEVNLGNTIDNGLYLAARHTGSNVDRVCFRGKTITAPFTIIATMNFRTIYNYTRGGIALSDGTRYLIIGFNSGSYGMLYTTALFYSTLNTYSSTPINDQTQRGFYSDMFVKIVDDGTNLSVHTSMDGGYWIQRYNESRTALFPSGVTQFGLGLSFYSATASVETTLKVKFLTVTWYMEYKFTVNLNQKIIDYANSKGINLSDNAIYFYAENENEEIKSLIGVREITMIEPVISDNAVSTYKIINELLQRFDLSKTIIRAFIKPNLLKLVNKLGFEQEFNNHIIIERIPQWQGQAKEKKL